VYIVNNIILKRIQVGIIMLSKSINLPVDKLLLLIIIYRSPRKTLLFTGVHDRPVSQAPHSFGDIRSDAVGTSDHHAPAESVLPAHSDGKQTTPE